MNILVYDLFPFNPIMDIIKLLKFDGFGDEEYKEILMKVEAMSKIVSSIIGYGDVSGGGFMCI